MKTLAPYFWVPGDDSGTDHFPLKRTSARVRIDGVIAEVFALSIPFIIAMSMPMAVLVSAPNGRGTPV